MNDVLRVLMKGCLSSSMATPGTANSVCRVRKRCLCSLRKQVFNRAESCQPTMTKQSSSPGLLESTATYRLFFLDYLGFIGTRCEAINANNVLRVYRRLLLFPRIAKQSVGAKFNRYFCCVGHTEYTPHRRISLRYVPPL